MKKLLKKLLKYSYFIKSNSHIELGTAIYLIVGKIKKENHPYIKWGHYIYSIKKPKYENTTYPLNPFSDRMLWLVEAYSDGNFGFKNNEMKKPTKKEIKKAKKIWNEIQERLIEKQI